MNAFLQYMVEEYPLQNRPQATIQTCIMARYNQELQTVIEKEFAFWRETLERCIKEVYGEHVGEQEAEALTILIAGLFLCNYSGALTGKINHHVLSLFQNLL